MAPNIPVNFLKISRGETARKQQFWTDFLSNDERAPIVWQFPWGRFVEILHDLKEKC